MKKFNYKPLVDYIFYHNMKYKSPEKAGTDKEKMEIFREKGQKARKIFTEIAKNFEGKMQGFKLQKVSGWMNQAQIARSYFWVYLKKESEKRDESGLALRLIEDKKEFGISLEVSFLERGIGENTLKFQNRVLEIPICSPLYYYVQINGENLRIAGNEENRQTLIKEVKIEKVRKVLVKYDIDEIEKFQTHDELSEELLKGYILLKPYYEITKR